MAYLAQWRLKLGAEILQSTEDGVAEVAATVGYGSEAAFNRAFKREFDCPPAQYRRSQAKRNSPAASRGVKKTAEFFQLLEGETHLPLEGTRSGFRRDGSEVRGSGRQRQVG